jgi:hypothetical protein
VCDRLRIESRLLVLFDEMALYINGAILARVPPEELLPCIIEMILFSI